MPDHPALPAALAARPVDSRRKLPIPYVSVNDDASHDFSVINGRRVVECVKHSLCSACGHPHQGTLAFIGGPVGFREHRYTDPPMHTECARWALRLCPYLAQEGYRRRRDTGTQASPGFTQMEKRDPVILAMADDCRVVAVPGADALVAIEFRPGRWHSAYRFEYHDGQLVETGREPLL